MSEMARYRKRPVVIEAVRWDGTPTEGLRIVVWAVAGGGQVRLDYPFDRMAIDTLEGTMWADPGDWIIRGVKGEFYPCKPDIFAVTYEPAEWGETP